MKLTKTNLNGLDFWYRGNDKFIGQKIAEGKYEEYGAILLLRQIYSDSVVVDVGANIGYYTVLMAQKVRKVYVFEPDNENFEILKKNVEKNNLKNVVLFNKAVGYKNIKVGILRNKDNYGDSRVISGDTTDCVRLDDVIKEKVDLMKIDTQGWEPAVIEGAKNIIEKYSPVLFLEYWPEGYKQAKLDGGKMLEFLRKNYKSIWRIDDNLNIFKKFNNEVDRKMGYSDMWMKKENQIVDKINSLKDIKIKKLIKDIIGYGKNK